MSMDLTSLVYELTSSFPKHELFGLTSQMRRAAVSICSNIAEGAGRGTRSDFRRFVLLARGSNCELHTQLLVAERLSYCSGLQLRQTEDLFVRVGRMLNGLANYLKAQGEMPSRSAGWMQQRPDSKHP